MEITGTIGVFPLNGYADNEQTVVTISHLMKNLENCLLNKLLWIECKCYT